LNSKVTEEGVPCHKTVQGAWLYVVAEQKASRVTLYIVRMQVVSKNPRSEICTEVGSQHHHPCRF